MEPKLDIKELLKTIEQWLTSQKIDVWDEQYDYVMHKNHWLTSEWSSKCDKCQMKGPSKPIVPKPLPSSSPVQQAATSTSLNSTVSNTLKNDSPTSSSPPPNMKSQPPPTEQIIPLTPIAPSHISNKAFITPHTSMKFNDTFTRSTRQSTRKLLNQQSEANNQLLINLNETFDLYQSALAETPVLDGATTNGEQNSDKAQNHQQQLLNLTSTNGSSAASNVVAASPLTTNTTNANSRMVPPKPRSNFELLTNNQTNLNLDFTPASMQEVVENHHTNHHAFSQPPASRITRIPVRSARQQDY